MFIGEQLAKEHEYETYVASFGSNGRLAWPLHSVYPEYVKRSPVAKPLKPVENPEEVYSPPNEYLVPEELPEELPEEISKVSKTPVAKNTNLYRGFLEETPSPDKKAALGEIHHQELEGNVTLAMVNFLNQDCKIPDTLPLNEEYNPERASDDFKFWM